MPLTHAKPSKLDMTAHFNVGSADPQTAAVRSNVALLSHQANILNMTWQGNHYQNHLFAQARCFKASTLISSLSSPVKTGEMSCSVCALMMCVYAFVC